MSSPNKRLQRTNFTVTFFALRSKKAASKICSLRRALCFQGGKNMYSIKPIIILVFLFVTGFVYAKDDGNNLLSTCNTYVKFLNGETLKSHEEIAALTCNQYIRGFKDSLILSGDVQNKVCIPDGMMSDQVARVVLKHLNLNPEILHKSRGATLIYTLEHGFPCTK